MKELTVEIIQKCTNNCIFCSSNSEINCTNKITIDTFKSIIDDAKRIGVNTLYISGGEPFLHYDLEDMIKIAKEKSLNTSIYTSGIEINMFNSVSSLNYFRLLHLSCLGIDKIVFDLPSINEDVYDILTNTKGRLKLVLESIQKCIEVGICTEVHFVPNKLNYKTFKELVDYCDFIGVSRINLIKLVYQGRANSNKDNLFISKEELEKFINEAERIKDSTIRIGNSFKNCSNCNKKCNKIVIKYNGDVLPCERFKDVEYINNIKIDNIYVKSLYSIYKESKLLKG